MEFYDSKGRIACEITESGKVYSWDGKPLGTLTGDKMHRCTGEFIGWIRYGYLINPRGQFCLFTRGTDTQKGPTPPNRRSRPAKGEKRPFPVMPTREGAPSFPKLIRTWGANPFYEPLGNRLRRRISSLLQIRVQKSNETNQT